MIPNLPRPLLWTEIKTMDEFLDGDIICSLLFDAYSDYHRTWIFPQNNKNNVEFMNEFYYQLTRVYYERPHSDKYYDYVNDITKDIGKGLQVELLMVMIYHYIRLRDGESFIGEIDLLSTIRKTFYLSRFWTKFSSINCTINNSEHPKIDPKKLSPVSPEKLKNMDLDWSKTTQNYDLETIIEIIKLWDKGEDKNVVASILMNVMPSNDSSLLHQTNGDSVRKYLMQIKEGEGTKPTSNIKLKSLKQESGKQDSSTMIIEALKRENKILKEEISKISAERDEYMRQAVKMAEELEIAHKEIQNAYQETKQNNDLTNQQIQEINRQMKAMAEKLGNTTIPLKSLADGLKKYAILYGPEKGKELLLSLSFILQKEHVWTDNAESLENFFINIEEQNKQATINVGGDYVLNKTVSNEVNGVASGATGINVKKE